MVTVHNVQLVGGDPALDFANTIHGTRDEPTDDLLLSPADVTTWARRAGVPHGRRPDLASALALRGTIFAVFDAVAQGRRPDPAALDALREAYVEAVSRAVLEEGTWTWKRPDPRWPVAVAAVDLLRSDRLARVKACAQCRWLFVDRSRNGSRRWCSMDDCGVAVKMRRYRASRRRAAPAR